MCLYFAQYVDDVRTFQEHVHRVEHVIFIINKEEDFYKLEETCYPEFDIIKDSADLYQRLFELVLNWQQTETRSDSIFSSDSDCVK